MATQQDKSADVQWTTISEEPEDLTRVTLSIVGDTFQGRYDGHKWRKNERGQYVQFRFTGADGKPYFINPGFMLKESMRKVARGTVTRITLTGFKDVGKGSQMQLTRVDTAPAGTPIPDPAVSREDMTAMPDRGDNGAYSGDWENQIEEPPF